MYLTLQRVAYLLMGRASVMRRRWGAVFWGTEPMANMQCGSRLMRSFDEFKRPSIVPQCYGHGENSLCQLVILPRQMNALKSVYISLASRFWLL